MNTRLPDKTSIPESLVNFRINISTESRQHNNNTTRNNTPARWIYPNKLVAVGNYKITKGFFYFGGKLDSRDGYSTDSALIDPTLPVNGSVPNYAGNEMGYWPSYSRITPESRSAYLEWLASSRDDPDAYIGYVFLYFYGLERRLLVDREKGLVNNKEISLLFQEIKRLLAIYGSNGSFRSYAVNLLSYIWILYGAKGKTPYELLFINGSPSPIFHFVLGKSIGEEKSIPADLAFAWLKSHPDCKLKTPAKRCPKKFRMLFEKRYREKFQPEGMVIKPNKTKLVITYQPANSSLHAPRPLETNSPDPAKLRAPVNKLIEIAELCQNELDAYSRFVGRQGNRKGSAAAVALLPPDLIPHLNLPGIERIKKVLDAKLTSGFSAVPMNYILRFIGDSSLVKLNKKECETIANILATAGYGMAPDVRFHHAKPEKNEKVVLYRKGYGKQIHPGSDFDHLVTILRLGSMVAKIDDKVDRSEFQVLNTLIQQNENLSPNEKNSLKAYLYWLISVPANMKGVKALLEKIGDKKRSAISKILIDVAHADGHIAPEEVKQLEKLYNSLGLEKTTVINDLHHVKTERKLQPDEPNTHFLKTDDPPIEKNSSNIINHERLRRLEEETAGVKNILEQIFIEPEEASDTVVQPSPTDKEDPSSRKRITGLDTEQQMFYNKLITKSEWRRDEIFTLCEQLNLMVDGSIEAINDRFFDIADAPLIEEDSDSFYIDLELISEPDIAVSC
jgi:uncharacterized tellurite resistance protein B-like protein